MTKENLNEATVFETNQNDNSVKKQLELTRNKASIHLLLSYDFLSVVDIRKFNELYEPLLDYILDEFKSISCYQTHIKEVDGKYELYVKYLSTRKVNYLFNSSAEAKEHAINHFCKNLNSDLNKIESGSYV